MEGKKEKVEQTIGEKDIIDEMDIPQKTFIKSDDKHVYEGYPEESYQQEEYPQGEYVEDEYIDEEYPNEEVDDENWEAEAGGSEPVPLGGIYGLFKEVLAKKDSKKVSNLDKIELGNWNLSVRDCERIALIAETFHHNGVANFFRNQSRIITDTAMSKSGWFTELFITSKRYASRDSSSSVSNLPQFNKKSKWRIFSEKENLQSQGPVQ